MLNESDIRTALANLDAHDDSWVVGVKVTTAARDVIRARSIRVEGDVAILPTSGGQRRIPLAAIKEVLVEHRSPGPE